MNEQILIIKYFFIFLNIITKFTKIRNYISKFIICKNICIYERNNLNIISTKRYLDKNLTKYLKNQYKKTFNNNRR
jgi:hypothetical protein